VIAVPRCKNSNSRSLMVILVRIKMCRYRAVDTSGEVWFVDGSGSLTALARLRTRSTGRCVEDGRDHRRMLGFGLSVTYSKL
jgi:hypothetical protein